MKSNYTLFLAMQSPFYRRMWKAVIARMPELSVVGDTHGVSSRHADVARVMPSCLICDLKPDDFEAMQQLLEILDRCRNTKIILFGDVGIVDVLGQLAHANSQPFPRERLFAMDEPTRQGPILNAFDRLSQQLYKVLTTTSCQINDVSTESYPKSFPTAEDHGLENTFGQFASRCQSIPPCHAPRLIVAIHAAADHVIQLVELLQALPFDPSVAIVVQADLSASLADVMCQKFAQHTPYDFQPLADEANIEPGTALLIPSTQAVTVSRLGTDHLMPLGFHTTGPTQHAAQRSLWRSLSRYASRTIAINLGELPPQMVECFAAIEEQQGVVLSFVKPRPGKIQSFLKKGIACDGIATIVVAMRFLFQYEDGKSAELVTESDTGTISTKSILQHVTNLGDGILCQRTDSSQWRG
jgi:chemotaxis response regulator CheB